MENTFMKQSVPCYHVANVNEAKMLQLPFGTTALLINDEAPFIYLKSSTAMGSTFRCFQITEVANDVAMSSSEERRLDRLEALVAKLVQAKEGKENESTESGNESA